MKKILINTNEEDGEKIFNRFKQICKEEFQEFKLQVGELIFIQSKIKVEEK